MNKIVTILLIAIGLLNFFPVVGTISATQLEMLYGLSFERSDAILLMRHRAVLFGLIGGFILFAAFRPRFQFLAALAGLISMSSFVLLAYLSEGDRCRPDQGHHCGHRWFSRSDCCIDRCCE